MLSSSFSAQTHSFRVVQSLICAAAMPFFSWQSAVTLGALWNHATALTGSQYTLTHEYSGANFFDGWDFYTVGSTSHSISKMLTVQGGDPTGGLVTYYSRSSSALTGLISTSENGPAYMGVNYVDQIPFDASTNYVGAGRPSVRIASKQAFTHGLFIGDFAHTPGGVCGTWPACESHFGISSSTDGR